MEFERSSGVLLHVSSLPGPYGIGDLGPAAINWIDWLSEAGCRYWQVLPLGPTGYGNSPYTSHSSAAGNVDLISPERLTDLGLVDRTELPAPRRGGRVDYGQVRDEKRALLQMAHARIDRSLEMEFAEFRNAEAEWLEPYSLFMSIKEAHGGGSWVSWPLPLRSMEQRAVAEARIDLAGQMTLHAFGQFIFYRQLEEVRRHAHKRGVEIIGDLPIYVAPDAVEVWLRPDLFEVDMVAGRPNLVGGVPPDQFSPVGQIWGNPVYRWDDHAREGYRWWAQRVAASLRLVDVLRIDHFTGYVRYFAIPEGVDDVGEGRWLEGPGADLFDSLQRQLGTLPIVAEDLGPLGDEVEEVRRQVGAPGMRVLQDAFDGDPNNQFLPENYPEDCVVYTGTHDNDTALGRLVSSDQAYRDRALAYTGGNVDDFSRRLVAAAWESRAVIAVAPVQDLLGLGSEARMNRPGTALANWEWRMSESALTPDLATRLERLNTRTGRHP